jgi:GDPmannose 4,6-dehydratase
MPSPDDYIYATGKLHTVEDICQIAFSSLKLNWQDFVTIDQKFYREAPKKNYYGDPSETEKKLNWQRTTSFKDMIETMVNHDMQLLKTN